MIRILAVAGALLLLLLVPLEGQAPKPVSKIMYVLPYFPEFSAGTNADFAARVADLRQRLGEGPYVRVGFNAYIFTSMDRWNLDPSDRAAVRANLATTITQVDDIVNRARAHNIPVSLSILTAIRSRYDPVQLDAEREDRRNTQWYADGDMAPGWVTPSRYARKLRSRLEAYVRELGTVLANRMALYPSTLVASSGDGEVELSYDRSPPFSPAHPNAASIEVTDYSPFAIAEFRDWLRNAGLYAAGQAYAGQGYAQASRYQGDASPSTDTNGDGRTLNGDFGTAFTSWTLRHFDWTLTDAIEVDPNAIASLIYDRPGFNGVPGTDPSRFDAPRVRQPGQAWWDVWDRFRQEMIWHYNVDFARWITAVADTTTGQPVPADRWFSHQVPADYLYGFTPQNPDIRFMTGASPHWSADISPYGGLGVTAFNVNVGGGNFASTLPTVMPHIAGRNVRWGILEWNPSVPVSGTPEIYEQEMAIIERYRPAVVVPWAWGHSFYKVENSAFETALRGLISRIKDRPPGVAPLQPPMMAPAPLVRAPGDADRLRRLLATFPSRDEIRDRARDAIIRRNREPRR